MSSRERVGRGIVQSGNCPRILITIATKLLELLHDSLDSLKLPKIIKVALKILKSFVLRGKKDGEKQNDSKNSE